MIDFRYHLVSIVAIFLALATGILLGTTLLQDPALDAAEKLSEQLTTEKQELRTQLDELRRRETGNDSFVTAMTGQLVAGGLTGQNVVLVETPGSTASLREQQQAVLEEAGAKVVGRISIAERYLDPKSTLLDQLSAQLKPVATTFPATATPYEKAAAVLGGALMTQGGEEPPAPVGDTVISAFETAGLISVEQDLTARASLAVLFAPETVFKGDNAELQADGLVALAAGLDQAGRGTVVTATITATATGGVLAAVRDGDAARTVSTVDTPDLPAGRIVVVYALQEQQAGGAGQYGVGTGASGFQPPVVAPTATPTPTSSGS
ncbi:copper transporter [Nonomuraea sp. NPDC050310]|uniref:copper transporter n=1 Tax=unclassified Nonomuraea TaxID=2593643 RepID=UPI0033EDB2B2